MITDEDIKTALGTIVANLRDGEVCKSMIDRLYGRNSLSTHSQHDKKKLGGFKKNIRKSELDKQEVKSAASDSCSKVNKELADSLVQSCNWLLEADILNIYSMKKEDLQALLHRASEFAKKINKGREAEDLLPDLQQEDIDEEEDSLRKRSRKSKFGSNLIEFEDDDADSDEDKPVRRPQKVKVVEGRDGSVKTFAVPPAKDLLAFKKPPARMVSTADAVVEDEDEILQFVKSVEKPLPKVEVRPLAVQAVDAAKLFGSSKLEQELKSAIEKSRPRSETDDDGDNIF